MSSMDLAFVVSQYRAVEIVDALADHPQTLDDLQHHAHACRRPLTKSLRLLAAHGLICRTSTSTGSWDRLIPCARYELTPAGRRLADRLSVLDVWTSLYEEYL